MSDSAELRALITGYRLSAAVNVAAELGLSDLLADGPRSVADLADEVSADPGSLHRLLRALATIGVYDEQGDGSFANTPVGEGLRSDVAGTLRPLARNAITPGHWNTWGHLGPAVQTGRNAFESLHGTDVWSYREAHPVDNAIFNANMTALTALVAGAVADSYDFTGLSTLVDVGGGKGVLLETVLARHPWLTGTVFDREHVVATRPISEALRPRWSAVGGSFFDEVPPADAYLLKSILHDWPDDRCIEILRTCRRSLLPGGVVLVVEALLGRAGHEVETAFSDLNMMVVPGGQERTQEEYAALFSAADLRLARVVDTRTRVAVLEARAD